MADLLATFRQSTMFGRRFDIRVICGMALLRASATFPRAQVDAQTVWKEHISCKKGST